MNPFQSYTPRVLPLEYDSLENEVGCQTITGTNVYSFKAFIEFCVAEHDSDSLIFSQPATVSYTEGPAEPAGAAPYRTSWAFWAATTGIRGGIMETVTPPANTSGDPSNLYPSTTPEALSAAFGADGLLAIAIQATTSSIEIKRYINEQGNTATTSFTGVSPCLVYTGLVFSAAEDGQDDLVCLYLRPEKPLALFARFARENFATEYVIHQNLPRPISRLIRIESDGFELALYAFDDAGFDITFHSAAYALDAGEEETTLEAGIERGNYFAAANEADTDEEFATLECAVDSGNYFAAVVEAATPATENATLSASVAGGLYTLAK